MLAVAAPSNAQQPNIPVEFHLVVDKLSKKAEKVSTVNGDIYIEKKVRITQDDIATITIVDFEQPHLLLKMTEEGRKKFYKLTKASIGRRLAIFVDKKYMMAPVIEQALELGEVAITAPTREEFEAIAQKLNAPYQVRIAEEKQK
ncbi:MAG TPA: hypothetical protein VI749_00690 [Candidatus Omnitrophota bacterium]|nr:hypothetical protein [Candidatus Omnitrophota bacterium]